MRYFKKSEFVKDPDRLHPKIMPLMDDLRHLAGVPIHIHVAWNDGGHSKKSYHYKGMAVDFHFGKGKGILNPRKLTPLEQFGAIRSIPEFCGIGYYPWWNAPGWHVDIRPPAPEAFSAIPNFPNGGEIPPAFPGRPLYWISPREGKYQYDREALIHGLCNKI